MLKQSSGEYFFIIFFYTTTLIWSTKNKHWFNNEIKSIQINNQFKYYLNHLKAINYQVSKTMRTNNKPFINKYIGT